MRAALVALALTLGLALASELVVPASVKVADGAFLSIPVEILSGGDRLAIEAPHGIELLSRPKAQAGKRLLNFYVEEGLRSGEYPLVFRLLSQNRVVASATSYVIIQPRRDIAVEVPPGKEILLGQRAEYWLGIKNTGNVQEKIFLSLKLPDTGVEFKPDELFLQPGERGEVRLTVSPLSPQPFVVVLLAKISGEPEYQKYVTLRTDVLPFAGAAKLGSRSLRYSLKLSGGPGSEGWMYATSFQIGGALSDYVNGNAAASYSNSGAAGRLSFYGDWGSAGLAVDTSGYALSVGSGSWAAEASYKNDLWSVASNWRPANWRLGILAGPRSQKAFMGYVFPLPYWMELQPSLSLTRFSLGPQVAYDWGGELVWRLSSPTWLASASGGYLAGSWSVSAQISRRRSDPYGVEGYGFYSAAGFGIRFSARELLNADWRAEQTLSVLRGSLSWLAGANYRSDEVPWRFGFRVYGSNLIPGVRVSGGYSNEQLEAATWLGWDGINSLQHGASLVVKQDTSRLTFFYDHLQDTRLGLRLSHNWKSWNVSGEYALDIDSQTGKGKGEIGYRSANWQLKSGIAGDATEVRWWLKGGYVLQGGLATPDVLAHTFGGFKTGRISGVIFSDSNHNGVRDLDEPAIAQSFVYCGKARAVSDASGHYSLESQPGKCDLLVQDPDGRLGLEAPLKLTFERNKEVTLDIPLVPIAGVSGEVWEDKNSNGSRDEGERALAGVTVRLVTPSGKTKELHTDGRGRFSASGLNPGKYRLELSPKSLPRLLAPGPAQKVELKAGPLPFIGLPAVPRKLEELRTFAIGDAAIFVKLEREMAPPGAEVHVSATVEGPRPEAVWMEVAGNKIAMRPKDGGVYRGYFDVPDYAKGVLRVKVRARFTKGELAQQVMLIVKPGALATLVVQPAFVDAGEQMKIVAHFLKRVGSAAIVVDGAKIAMSKQDDFTWAAEVVAPRKAGYYQVELLADGRTWAKSGFRVAP